MADQPARPGVTRRLSQGLWWVGLALTLAGLAAFALSGSRTLPALLAGAGLAALGLNILLGGELIAGPEPRFFNARGQAVRGYLEVAAGLADLTLSSGPNDRIAALRYGPLGRPDFQAESGTAHLRLRSSLLRPNISAWQASLASNVLWDITARSSLGRLALDLRGLRLETVSARTAWGHISLLAPTRGYTRIDLRTVAGEIEIVIPDGVAARISIQPGLLATITNKNERLQPLSRRRYATPDFDLSAAQMEIHIEAAAGDVILS